MLINTKFKIDSQMVARARLSRSLGTTIYMFGRVYQSTMVQHAQIFQEDFRKKLWLTYRKGFAPLLVEKNKVAKLQSDAGWGCVIRCTQMIIANAMQKLQLSRLNERLDAKRLSKLNVGILRYFDDDKRNRPEAAFSVQNVVELGLEDHARLPGEWYGVQTANDIFKKLADMHHVGLKLCQFKDGEIVTKEILREAMGEAYDCFAARHEHLGVDIVGAQEDIDESEIDEFEQSGFLFEEVKSSEQPVTESTFDFDLTRKQAEKS